MRYVKILAALLAVLLLAGCASAPAESGAGDIKTAELFAMDTYMEIKAYDASDELMEQAEKAIYSLEARLSATKEDSEISLVNANGGGEVSEDTLFILRRALEICGETQGALDISVYPVVRAWGFTTESYRVPEASELESLLKNVDYEKIAISEDTVTLSEGMEIDLGSVAKGYTVDMLRALFTDAGVDNALFNLGGNVLALGQKPDGSTWRVGIQHPEGQGIIGVAELSGKALITSGGYERYFEDGDGNVYWHIMDTETGRPAKSGLISVTVMGEEGLYCDALSTALFVMGAEKAEKFWREQGDFDMALITDDGRLILTPGLNERFTPADACDYEITVIEDA